MAAENALQRVQMEQMRAMLVANGLNTPGNEPVQGTSAQALANSYPFSQPNLTPSVKLNTPSRKRHSSQQLERSAKDARVYSGVRPVTPPRDRGLVRRSDNLGASVMSNLQVKGTFEVSNEKAMRQEIEIALETMNGETFRGSLTRTEVKHNIYRECLGFEDFENFDGVRFGFNRVPIIKIKLVTPINVDELYPIQHFVFKRKTSRQGRTHVDTIQCKIQGLRHPSSSAVHRPDSALSQESIDEGIRILKIDGCDYKIPEGVLIQFLSSYGEIMSEILEDLFEDGICPESTSGGLNRTGIYSVKIKLKRDIPQILPILGKKIKIHYKGIQKLCPRCFGPHPKQVCHSKKIEWKDYISRFMLENKVIPKELYGKWFNSELQTRIRQADTVESDSEADRPQIEISLPPNDPTTATADWVKSQGVITDSAANSAVGPKPVVKNTPVNLNRLVQTYPDDMSNEPKKADFRVPETRAEHEKMIDSLIKGGTLLGEAEQIIASRITAFNKACREHKKMSGKPSKWIEKSQKGQNKKKNQSQRVIRMEEDHVS